VQVLATTGILADLVRHVGGARVRVTSLVPDGADPHSYEPSLRDVRNVVYADAAFSNYLLLEQHSFVRTLDANLPDGVPNIALAEGAVKYAAEIIPLIEDISLDTIWLGLRVRGAGAELGADRGSEVRLAGVGAEGPGDVVAYLTESFGRPERYIDSSDGFDETNGFRDDTARLPPDAHSHMSWAFTEPGIHRLSMQAALSVDDGERPRQLGSATFTFAVGVDPQEVPGMAVEQVLDGGHADVTVDLDTGELLLLHDPEGGGEHSQHEYDPATTVIEVPNVALHDVPPGPGFRFLGRPGEQIHQLPQAVLGKHVHGEIDPHLWHDARNAIAYVQLIRDTLIDVDPDGALEYRSNAADYIDELTALDDEVRGTIAQVPERARHLITTHDAFGYLANAYDLEISGFVTPNPSSEPSLAARRKLTETIRNLDVPAVFLEPNLAARSSTLLEVAGELDVEVCPIYGDTFDDRVDSYVAMMRFNARSIRRCLNR
jgi:anchored repeat ABC transporter substrate-binding protein